MGREKLTGHIEKVWNFRDKIVNANAFIDENLNRTLTMFKYKGLPDTIPEKELERILQVNGYGIVTDGSQGLLALWGGFAPPLDAYYKSTKLIVNNPWVASDYNKTYTFDEDCVKIVNTPNFIGLMPILEKYAVLTVESNITLLNAIISHRAMFMPTADDDNGKASVDLWLEKLEAGTLTCTQNSKKTLFGDGKGISTQPYSQGSGNSITQIIELKQYINGQFYNDIGIDANYNMKRERLTAGETELNKPALRPLVDAMLEERQKFCEKINEKYGTDITVEFNSSWSEYNAKRTEFLDLVGKFNSEDKPAETTEETTTEEPVEETATEEPAEDTVEEVIEEIAEKVDEILEEVKESEDEEEVDRSNAEPNN